MTVRVNCWSGPRNVSTAVMYSFAQRADTRVVDEPLYGHYLRVSGAPHPGRDEVLAAMQTNGERVVREVILGPCDRAVIFFKQMAHHLLEVDRGFLRETINAFLVRDPHEMLPSLARSVREPCLRDTGLAIQTQLLDELLALGQDPPILDAREVLLDPEKVLGRFCERIGIAFDPAMLSWEAGARVEDGIWAPHWYAAVHTSTGLRPYAPRTEPFPDRLRPLLKECVPHYDRLRARAIEA